MTDAPIKNKAQTGPETFVVTLKDTPPFKVGDVVEFSDDGWTLKKVADGRGLLATDAEIEKIARAICREQCAFYGEPPCHDHGWPNPDCNEPGCIALARAAAEMLGEKGAG